MLPAKLNTLTSVPWLSNTKNCCDMAYVLCSFKLVMMASMVTTALLPVGNAMAMTHVTRQQECVQVDAKWASSHHYAIHVGRMTHDWISLFIMQAENQYIVATLAGILSIYL